MGIMCELTKQVTHYLFKITLSCVQLCRLSWCKTSCSIEFVLCLISMQNTIAIFHRVLSTIVFLPLSCRICVNNVALCMQGLFSLLPTFTVIHLLSTRSCNLSSCDVLMQAMVACLLTVSTFSLIQLVHKLLLLDIHIVVTIVWCVTPGCTQDQLLISCLILVMVTAYGALFTQASYRHRLLLVLNLVTRGTLS